MTGPLVGGAKLEVTTAWTVPTGTNAHPLYVVVDPALVLDDRDRSNNSGLSRTVLPDLAIETCWNEAVSSSSVILIARVGNPGVLPTGPFALAWRLGAADGQEVGRLSVDSLAVGQTNEVSFVWDTSGRQFTGAFTTVYAVADAGGVVAEADETNNAYPQAVRVVPSWVPRVIEFKLVETTKAKLTFEASGALATEFTVQTAGSFVSPVQWQTESEALIAESALGAFEVQLPIHDGTRFYRIVAK